MWDMIPAAGWVNLTREFAVANSRNLTWLAFVGVEPQGSTPFIIYIERGLRPPRAPPPFLFVYFFFLEKKKLILGGFAP